MNEKTRIKNNAQIDEKFEPKTISVKAFLKTPKAKEEYQKLEPFIAIQKQLIDARIKQKLTQKKLAEKMNIKPSAISRFETKTPKDGRGWNIATLINYARNVGLQEIKIPIC